MACIIWSLPHILNLNSPHARLIRNIYFSCCLYFLSVLFLLLHLFTIGIISGSFGGMCPSIPCKGNYLYVSYPEKYTRIEGDTKKIDPISTSLLRSNTLLCQTDSITRKYIATSLNLDTWTPLTDSAHSYLAQNLFQISTLLVNLVFRTMAKTVKLRLFAF